MSKRISKAVREEAAQGCQMAASTEWHRQDDVWQREYTSFAQFFRSTDAAHLADAAWEFALKNANGPTRHNGAEFWAEAEAMLRTGWVP